MYLTEFAFYIQQFVETIKLAMSHVLCSDIDKWQEYYQSHHFTTFRQLLLYSQVMLCDEKQSQATDNNQDLDESYSNNCTVLYRIVRLLDYSHIWSPTVFAERKQKVGMQIVFCVQKVPSRQPLCCFSPVSMCMSEPSGTRCGKLCSGRGEVFLW